MIRSEPMKTCLADQKPFMLLFNFLFALFPHKFVLWAEALRQDWAESGKLELPKMGNLELKLWKMLCLVWTGRDNYEEDTLQSSLQFVPKTPKVKFQRDNYEEDTLQSSLQFVPKTPKVKFSESQSLKL